MKRLMRVIGVIGLPQLGLEWHRIEPDEPACGIGALGECPAPGGAEQAILEIGVQWASLALTEEPPRARSRTDLCDLRRVRSCHPVSSGRGPIRRRTYPRSPC